MASRRTPAPPPAPAPPSGKSIASGGGKSSGSGSKLSSGAPSFMSDGTGDMSDDTGHSEDSSSTESSDYMSMEYDSEGNPLGIPGGSSDFSDVPSEDPESDSEPEEPPKKAEPPKSSKSAASSRTGKSSSPGGESGFSSGAPADESESEDDMTASIDSPAPEPIPQKKQTAAKAAAPSKASSASKASSSGPPAGTAPSGSSGAPPKSAASSRASSKASSGIPPVAPAPAVKAAKKQRAPSPSPEPDSPPPESEDGSFSSPSPASSKYSDDEISEYSDLSGSYAFGAPQPTAKGAYRSGAETSNFEDDSDYSDDEHNLPAPPDHIMAKSKKAPQLAALAALNLEAGLNPSKPMAKLTKDVQPGDFIAHITKDTGFQIGMWIEVGVGPDREVFQLKDKGSLIMDRPFKQAWKAGTQVVGSWTKPAGFESLLPPRTPATLSVATTVNTADTPTEEPDEPPTPSSYRYSGFPSPPGSISGFSQRSQQANLFRGVVARDYGYHLPGDSSPGPGPRRLPPAFDIDGPYERLGRNSTTACLVKAVKEGYAPIMGKFEAIGDDEFPDDAYEEMFYKYVPPHLKLLLESSPEEPVDIQVDGGRTFVVPDPEDMTHCFMESRPQGAPATLLSFKTSTEKTMDAFLDQLPDSCREYPVDDEQGDEGPSPEEKDSAPRGPADAKFSDNGRDTSGFGNIAKLARDKLALQRKLAKAKGESEDPGTAASLFPEGELFGRPPGPPPDEPFEVFDPPSDAPPGSAAASLSILPPPPAPRSDLVAARIRKSCPSVRRIRLLCRWIDILRFWPTKITIANMHTETCSGLFLIELMKKLLGASCPPFVNVNKNSLCKAAACQNLNQALTVIFQSKTVNATRVPSPDEIFHGNMGKITTLLDEIFNVYARAPLYQLPALKMLQWYQSILRAYQMPLPREVLEEGDVSSKDQLWKHFRSGVGIFCILFHFYGPSKIPVCGKHSTRSSHQGELAPIDKAEWAAAPPHIRAMVEASAVDRAIDAINKEIVQKKDLLSYGVEHGEDDYSIHFSLGDLEKTIQSSDDNMDKGKALTVVNALVSFHRLSETLSSDGKVHYQAYCDRCARSIRLDPMRIVQHPVGFTDHKANVTYVLSLLTALSIDVVWEVDELLTNPDCDFLLLQLSYVYDALKLRQGVLPPASGKDAGYTSGPNGETLIVGMVFADTNPVLKILPAIERGSKTIVLGAGHMDIPFTPIDSTVIEDAQAALDAKRISREQYEHFARFAFADECPLGMLSDHVTITRTSHATTWIARQRKTAPWNNQSTDVLDEDPRRLEVVSMLKKSHQRTATATATATATGASSAASASKVMGAVSGGGEEGSGSAGGSAARSVDWSKMQSTARQSTLNKMGAGAAVAGGSGAAAGAHGSSGAPASPAPARSRRYSVTAIDRRGMEHKTVFIDSAEQGEFVKKEQMRAHRRKVLDLLADDRCKADKQLEVLDIDHEQMLEELTKKHEERMAADKSGPNAPDPAYDRDLSRHTELSRAIAEDRERVTRFFQMRREAIEEQYNEFKMRNVTFARRSDPWKVTLKAACHADLLVAVSQGGTSLELSSTLGFVGGQYLELGTGAALEKVRLVEITTLADAATAAPSPSPSRSRPGAKTRESNRRVLVVEPPLRNSHPRGTLVVGLVSVSTLALDDAASANLQDQQLAGPLPSQTSVASKVAGSLREKMLRLSKAAKGKVTASKQLREIQATDGMGVRPVLAGSFDSGGSDASSLASGLTNWSHPEDKQRKSADLMLKQVHLPMYMPQPSASERREHAKFPTEAAERAARKLKSDLDSRLPGNFITLAWVHPFVEHAKKTKAALDKRFPGNAIPLDYVEHFVVREMSAARRDEKGWNLTNTKLHTYNASIKQKTDANAKLLQESWTTDKQRKIEADKRERQVERARAMLGLQSSEMGSLGHGTGAAAGAGAGDDGVSVISGGSSWGGGVGKGGSAGGSAGASRAMLHAETALSRDPEAVFHRFKVKLIAQNHVFGKKLALGSQQEQADPRNAAEREFDKLVKLGLAVSTKKFDHQWGHRKSGESGVTLKLLQKVQSDLRHQLSGSEKSPLLPQLLELDDPFAERPESQGHLSAAAKQIGSRIRSDELLGMLFEDLRGDLSNEPGFRKKMSPSAAPVATPVAPPPTTPAIVPPHLAEFQAKQKADSEAALDKLRRQSNVETALDFLNNPDEPFAAALADRHVEVEFFFAVTKTNTGGVTALDYTLHWSKVSGEEGGNEPSAWQGSVSLADVKSISEISAVDKRGTITISIDSQNARALKSCGGRTRLVLKGDVSKMGKFRDRLVLLKDNIM